MVCTGCGQDKPTKARGLCAACYTHLQKYGTTERVRMKRVGGCSVDGCDRPIKGRGLCELHLVRQRRTGTIEKAPAPAEPLLTHHPLYPQWVDFKRTHNPRPVIAEWKDDFEAFLAGVGTRPSSRHRLYRIDKQAPMGPGNFEWRLALVEKIPGEDGNEYRKRYRVAHKDAYRTDYHDAGLRSKFGADFGFRDYQRMLEEQNGCCAICGRPESSKRGGRVKALAVDHDHGTGAIRGLLCDACNTGLGKFRDDTALLTKAIAYLVKHGKVLNT